MPICAKIIKVNIMDDYTTSTSKESIDDETGAHFVEENIQVIYYPFGKYLIKVKVDKNKRFLGILEVSLNKDFLSRAQKISSLQVHDLEEFYKEDE